MVGKKLEFDEELFGKKEKKGTSGFLGDGERRDNTMAVAFIASLGVLVLLILTYQKENWWVLLLMGLFFLASELFALPLKGGGRLSLAMIPVVVAMMTSGPLVASLISLFGIPVFWMEREESGVRRVAFNTCQYFLSAGLAAWVFSHTGGEVLNPGLKNAGGLVFPWLLATIVFFAVNTCLVTPLLARKSESLYRFWLKKMLPKLLSYFVYSVIGFLSAILYVRLEVPALVLLFAPLLGMRVVYTRYEAMRDVCDETSLAVVEAIEERSLFSKGHSVAVAEMSVEIAEELGLNDEDIHFMRRAALLHDIGKLPLNPQIFAKAEMLGPEEWEEIKKHPLIAGEILSKESSIEPVAPAVLHHHEMTDGSGYVDGLAGDAIPMGSRILAVADAFDAMQRPSPRREPLDAYGAVSEIIRAKGIQFDPEVVDAFVNIVVRKGIWEGARQDPLKVPESYVKEEPVTVEEQPTLEEALKEKETANEEKETGDVSGIEHYEELKSGIEKDIEGWERTEVGTRRIRRKRVRQFTKEDRAEKKEKKKE
ncbi:MAG: HD-GYP domain-containing protein [Actinomycetota bacterium]|nr:HD-GYP domain-containing protein [Actinomycetota bacterium]